MTRTTPLFATLTLALATATAWAQPELPRPSPKAMVMQTIGLTDVTLEYYSPAARGRTIWGELVPFGKVWRTGANACTKLTLSRKAKVAGKDLAAGTYCLYTIPAKKGDWTLLVSSNAKAGGTRGFDRKKHTVLTAKLKTSAIPHRERMTFLFNDTKDDGASLDLEWAKLRVSIPIRTDTGKQALANIDKALEAAWRPHATAARYMLDTIKDYKKALAYIDTSIAIERTWFNTWIRADILSRLKRYKEAYAAAQKAWELGNKAEYFFWKDRVKKALEEWKGKK